MPIQIRRQLFGRFINVGVEQAFVFMVPYFVLTQYHDFSLSALAFLAEWVPRIVGILLAPRLLRDTEAFRLIFQGERWKVLLVLACLSSALFFKVPPAILLVILSGIFGFCYEISFAAFERGICDSYNDLELKTWQSRQQGIEQVGYVIGPLVAAMAVETFDVKYIFWSALIFALLSAFAAFCPRKSIIYRSTERVSLTDGLSLISKNSRLSSALLIGFFLNLELAFLLFSSPYYIENRLFADPKHFSWILSLTGLLCAASLLALPRLLKKISLDKLGIAAFFSCALILLSMPFFKNIFMFGTLFASYFIADNIAAVFIRSIRAQAAQGDDLSSIISVSVLVFMLPFPLIGLLGYFLNKAMIIAFAPLGGLLILAILGLRLGGFRDANSSAHAA